MPNKTLTFGAAPTCHSPPKGEHHIDEISCLSLSENFPIGCQRQGEELTFKFNCPAVLDPLGPLFRQACHHEGDSPDN